jgi:hypothetical protein
MRGLLGRHMPPRSQRISAAITTDLLDQLQGEPALRVATTTGRTARTYSGGALTPQRFLSPAPPNSPGDLSVVPVQINARSALSKTRGSA